MRRALAAPADDRRRHRPSRPWPVRARGRAPEPWATVNRCDTTAHPNQIGIRASMPGLARRTRMFMRFRVQYQDGDRVADDRAVADSGWSRVAQGPARRATTPAGRSGSIRRPRAARSCCAAWSPSSGGAGGASCGATAGSPRRAIPPRRGPTRRTSAPRRARSRERRRRAEQPRVVRDHARDPERLQRADARRIVDGPDVEVAAGVARARARAAASRAASAPSAHRSARRARAPAAIPGSRRRMLSSSP